MSCCWKLLCVPLVQSCSSAWMLFAKLKCIYVAPRCSPAPESIVTRILCYRHRPVPFPHVVNPRWLAPTMLLQLVHTERARKAGM
jgi:hypothetical protein